MKVIHGRKGEWNEYLETKIDKPKIAVIAQKTNDVWHLYLRRDGAIRTYNTYHTSEDARFALDVAVQTIIAYSKI